MPGRAPDFVIIGAQKAGSSVLLNSLRQHPDVWMPASEEPFFRDPVFSEDGLPAFYARYAHRREPRLGLKCPDYLARPEVAARLARYLDTPNLLVCLRDPVARAVSAYFWRVRWGVLPVLPVEEGMRRILDGGLHDHDPTVAEVLDWGRYATHLVRYLDVFPREKVHVLIDRDLRVAPDSTMNEVAGHLGIAPRGAVALSRGGARGANEGVYSLRRLRFLQLRSHMVLRWNEERNFHTLPKPRRPDKRAFSASVAATDRYILSRLYGNARPRLSAELDAELRDYYRDDVVALERLLGRELGWTQDTRRSLREPQ